MIAEWDFTGYVARDLPVRHHEALGLLFRRRQSIVCQSEGDTRELWEWTDLYTLDLTKLMIGVLSQEDLLKINEVIRMKRKAAL